MQLSLKVLSIKQQDVFKILLALRLSRFKAIKVYNILIFLISVQQQIYRNTKQVKVTLYYQIVTVTV